MWRARNQSSTTHVTKKLNIELNNKNEKKNDAKLVIQDKISKLAPTSDESKLIRNLKGKKEERKKMLRK